jgi:hypothetical protein
MSRIYGFTSVIFGFVVAMDPFGMGQCIQQDGGSYKNRLFTMKFMKNVKLEEPQTIQPFMYFMVKPHSSR